MLDAHLDQIRAHAVSGKAEEMRAYHKADRVYLGASNPEIDLLVKHWRTELSLEERLSLAADLWASDIHEGRIAAAKLLTQARIRPSDEEAWALICSWVPEFDAWAIADHVCIAAQKRIIADPSRLDDVEGWTSSELMWARRAALVATLPFAKLNNPKPAEIEARERVLGWAASYLGDRDWFIQKAVAWWLRDLSKHDPARTRAFLNEHGPYMRSFARKEAAQYLPPEDDGSSSPIFCP
ncbi:DNA alkylation repair protein [Cereibacter changlensis]|uniref:DNA alkylation repair protein n=1 Tax=Cereibacter changlensis TaxID=402884 RepID=A0A4U0YZ33_9RHOB|nr:DNA alkylation repair protein [Cereibacter changlensis]TKA95364.1 DNA alkylation repair protein [Cereibacter changlensis]